MIVVYVGQLWAGGTCRMRLRGLESLGHTTYAVDTTPESRSARRILPRIASRLGYPLDLTLVHRRLLELCREVRPNLIWVDKGQVITSRCLSRLKLLSPRAILVHYNPDDPFGAYGKSGWRTFLKAVPYYDVHFVPRKVNIEEYRARGAKMVYRAAWGFCPETHRPMRLSADARQEFGGEVGFIGSYEQERANSIDRLAATSVAVRVWGDGWHRRRSRSSRLRLETRSLFGESYVRAINSFDINLSFVRRANRDQQTTRTYEIPACAAFMLTERTEEHLELFQEGKEAEFFSVSEELVSKARFYLQHAEARRRIAEAGRQRCLLSGYDYPSRMKDMLRQVNLACAG